VWKLVILEQPKSADGTGDLISLAQAGSRSMDVLGWSTDDQWVYAMLRDTDETAQTCNRCELLRAAADGSGTVEVLWEGDYYTAWQTVF